MSESYKVGLSVGEWLRDKELWSPDVHRKTIAALLLIGDYLWLIAGLLLIWVGVIGIYVIYSTGDPSTPSIAVFIGVFCLYSFVKLRVGSRKLR